MHMLLIYCSAHGAHLNIFISPERRNMERSFYIDEVERSYSFWVWLISHFGVQLPLPLSASTIWMIFSMRKDVLGRQCAAATFFHAIFVLWTLRNDSKHKSRKPSPVKAKLILLDQLQGMVRSSSNAAGQPPLPVLSMLQ